MNLPDTSALIQQAMHMLGANQLQGARELYKKICDVRPDDAQSWLSAAAISGELGLADEAKEYLRRTLTLEPDHEEAYFALATILNRENHSIGALEACERALEIDLNYPEAELLRSGILGRIGRYTDAIASAENAIRLNPESAEAYVNLANGFHGAGMYEKAADAYKTALALEPGLLVARVALVEALVSLGQFEEAESLCEQLKQLVPDDHGLLRSLARIHERRGRYQDAYDVLQKLIEANALETASAVTFAHISRHLNCGQEAARVMNTLLSGSSLNPDERRHLHMALGKLYDALNEFDNAFPQFEQGNARPEEVFDPSAYKRDIERQITFFSRERMQWLPRAKNHSDLPVFIVGMPRSGTTLVEQILSSHPNIAGAGELTEIARISGELAGEAGVGTPYPEVLEIISPDKLEEKAQQYLQRLRKESSAALRITDKLPGNFLHLGLIELLFPGSRVIHCLRDPLDTCLSCYTQPFRSHYYTRDLNHLGFVYQQYRQLMQHWLGVLNIPVFELQYEDLVEDTERWGRQLVEFCGLPWDDRCLDFHASNRTVLTASYDQVRRPIYHSSVRRWKNYADQLQPLRTALGRYSSD